MLEFDFKARVGTFHLHAQGRQRAPRMGLFGPSGCGKTTLLNCLAGLVRPYEGFISFDGQVVFDASTKRHVPSYRRAIGYVFQEGRLFPHMTVRGNIEYGRRRGANGPNLAEVSEVLNLQNLLERAPETLSAGERQRVALARALAAGPKLLLLDEPLPSLDEPARLRILPYLMEVYEKWRLPFVYVSHTLTEILFLAEMSWQMSRGQIERCVHPRGLLAGSSHAVDPVLNILTGIVREVPPHTGYAVVACGSQRLKAPDEGFCCGDAVAVALPARDLMLSLSPPQGLSARNVFPASIRHMEQNGNVLWVIAEAGDNELVVELTEEAGRELNLRPGLPVYVIVKSHSITVRSLKRKGSHEG
jgi:molybdate transport system ATP-binding protein